MAVRILKDVENNIIDISDYNLDSFKTTYIIPTFVQKTRKIAGIDLVNDISVADLSSVIASTIINDSFTITTGTWDLPESESEDTEEEELESEGEPE